MAKRITRVTLERQAKWLREHQLSLEIDELMYEPFWRTEDVSSSGIKCKIPHFKTPMRLMHLLSQNELWMYLHLVRNPLVLEVYEQIAIPLDFSLAIAKELEIKHPVYSDSRVPIVQTIDFIVDMFNPDTGEYFQAAYPVKQKGDAMRERTMEKLAIQEAYCQLQHIEYHLTTSDDLRTVCSENLEALYRHRQLSPFLKNTFEIWLSNFIGCLSENRHDRVAHIIENAAKVTGIERLIAVNFFYHALWHKRLDIDCSKRLKLEMPASDLKVYSAYAA